MRKNERLMEAIMKKYPSEAACARAMGWPRQRLNKITTNVREPDLKEVRDLANATDYTVGEMAKIFLDELSPNGQQSA